MRWRGERIVVIVVMDYFFWNVTLRERNGIDRAMDCYQREIAAMFTMHNHPANSLRFSTLSSLYPTNTITQVLTNQSANNLPSFLPSFLPLNPFPPKSAPCSSVCFQTIDTASPSSFLSPLPLHFDASNNLAAAPSARTRTPSVAPSRSIQSPPSFAAPAFYSINSPPLPCFGTNCSWFVRMSRRRDVVHFPNFILK